MQLMSQMQSKLDLFSISFGNFGKYNNVYFNLEDAERSGRCFSMNFDDPMKIVQSDMSQSCGNLAEIMKSPTSTVFRHLKLGKCFSYKLGEKC